jgi:hypothetical protein
MKQDEEKGKKRAEGGWGRLPTLWCPCYHTLDAGLDLVWFVVRPVSSLPNGCNALPLQRWCVTGRPSSPRGWCS